MTERTPNLSTIRHAWAKAHPFPLTTDVEERYTEFDRAIAAHDAEKRAEWEAEHDEQQDTIVKLRDQIEEARTAWWSATEQGDNGLIYTDRIEDAMDDIWSAIGHAEWVPARTGAAMTERKPKWAWSSVDDPNPHYPKCDRCDAFARWSVGEVGNECTFADVTIRYFACGAHINRVLMDADWLLDTLCIYDITYEPERS